MKILILSPNIKVLFTPELKKRLSAIGDVSYIEKIQELEKVKELFEGDEERIVAIDPDFSEWKFENKVIEKIPKLKAICLQTTGFDWIDIEFCKKKRIPVTNLRGFSSEAVAEWAITMALNVARQVPRSIRAGWEQNYGWPGIELKGKTAGVVGMGRIGGRIAELCKAFGMRVQYWSRRKNNEDAEWVELSDLMSTSDVVLLALPLSPETKGLISAEYINKLKKTAIFVSVINHGIYDHELIVKKAQAGEIFGYAFEDEGGKTFNKYSGNIWAGPAIGWCTTDSFNKNAEQWTESILLATDGKYPNNIAT